MDNTETADVQDCIPRVKMRQVSLYVSIILLILASGICYASSLEDAKDIVDKYYQYSMEKDVDSYISLFDQEYLNKIYGDDHKELFDEIFNYFEIQEYDLDFQYYTESDDSMTLFFNLQSETSFDGEKTEVDNDLVAFFTKDPLKLRYIILQEEFIGQMNREFIYESAITAIVEKNSDLKAEAEEKGVSLTDYNLEEKIAEHNAKHSSVNKFWIIMILVAVLFITYQFAIKNDAISKHIKDKKIKSRYLHVRQGIIRSVEKTYSIIKRLAKKTFRFLVSSTISLYRKTRKR